MSLEIPVDPALLHVFARSVGDDDPADRAQLFGPSVRPVTAPLTFTRAVAEHFDDDGELRRGPDGQPLPPGGSDDRFHAEQHFEYVRPLRAGERLTALTRPGTVTRKQGRAGLLEFTETHTDFVDDEGNVVVRSRRVGVQVHPDPR
ncbi:FAS1-like dehydratase domain-containing protein [Geodermatophilus sp. CPCC 205506]|uniref:FAS1-like dehydratase domain-containing protein n=1 Tax=Geodermatophilus sp. CPCC 205506 TaxID=2936596 RepID=UPI003EEE3CF1